MTRPSAFASANFTPNYNDDDPDLSSRPSVPQDKAWSHAFFAADPNSQPTLTAFKGYDYTDWGRPFYYADDLGVWRDTMNERPWITFEAVRAKGVDADAAIQTLGGSL